MKMFNFRNLFNSPENQLDSIVDNIKDRGSYTVDLDQKTAPEQNPSTRNALYKVGMNDAGMTQLTVGYPTSVTLTLNDAGVAHLIKLLSVNIDSSYQVVVAELTND